MAPDVSFSPAPVSLPPADQTDPASARLAVDFNCLQLGRTFFFGGLSQLAPSGLFNQSTNQLVHNK